MLRGDLLEHLESSIKVSFATADDSYFSASLNITLSDGESKASTTSGNKNMLVCHIKSRRTQLFPNI